VNILGRIYYYLFCKNASQYNFTYKYDISIGGYNRYVEIRELKLILVNTTIYELFTSNLSLQIEGKIWGMSKIFINS
jgi:hypothetical protein